MNKILLSVGSLVVLIFTGCEKNENNPGSTGKVELYMIETYSKVEFSSQIDENSVVTEKSPLIYYQDFLSYDSTEYTFELSDRAIKSIQNLDHSVHGLAFAIKANNTLIYTGYFLPGYSSASCDWIVIDPIMITIRNKMQVKLGYPGLVQGQIIEDKRNDKRIVRIFKQDNKLK